MKSLAEIWKNLCLKYSSDTVLIDQFWSEINHHYTHKNRHYHNLIHLEYMLQHIDRLNDKLVSCDRLQFSIFYHDIIYNVKRQDNELKSAEVAQDRLKKLGLPDDIIRSIYQQILATKSHERQIDSDTNYLLDIDLGILGEPWESYLLYTQNIRKEYALYPNFLYKRGRKKVLKHFLAMESIFKTEEFLNTHEKITRENLKKELSLL